MNRSQIVTGCRARLMAGKRTMVPVEQIERTIFLLRGQKVLLSPHLAELYGVEARILVQAVKRNLERFPEDFMFQLTREEYENLKSQIVISSWGGPRRARPYAFTEQGVAMGASDRRRKVSTGHGLLPVAERR